MKLPNILWLILLFLLGVTIFYYDLITYGIVQARGQLEIIYKARPVSAYLNNPDYPDSLKAKLRRIQEIKSFAVDELGLNQSDNYTTIYNQQGKPVLWVVTACEPYRLKSKKWKFPLLGSVQYKGFFKKPMADSLASELIQQGWDVRIREVGAWSTLGIFNDPILSNMLDRPIGSISETVIHELTHGTLFVKDSVTFNENLASFIGEKGAQAYLARTFGPESRELRQYLRLLHDQDQFARHMIRGAHYLDQLYNSWMPGMDTLTMDMYKHAAIDRILSTLDTVSFYRKGALSNFNVRPNNAYFQAFLRYRKYQDAMELQLINNFENDLRAFLEFYKSSYANVY